jgi:hypothetical protein
MPSTKNSKPANGGSRPFPRRSRSELKQLILLFLDQLLADTVRPGSVPDQVRKKKG